MRVNLVLLNPNKAGGTVTMTAHLYHSLIREGHEVYLYRLASRTAPTAKEFGYGCWHRPASLDYIKSRPGHTHITACIGNNEYGPATHELVREGATVCVCDPNDLSHFDDRSFAAGRRVTVMRRGNLGLCPNATFVPPPFIRANKGFVFDRPRPRWAVTLSRLGAIKRTEWVLQANRRLPDDRKIWLRGYDDRFFTFNAFVRDGRYPEFVQDSARPADDKMGFAKVMGEAQRVAGTARILVDLSVIRGDGGGIQYTFLEGIDAGCVLLLNREWVEAPHSLWTPGINCLAAGSVNTLVNALTEEYPAGHLRDVAAAAHPLLDEHEPRSVVERYIAFFQSTRGAA